MTVDSGACIGCKACVAACQAENNTPVVGREEVLRGREMHWLRVDVWHEGTPDRPRRLFQPVPCMHCEKAPCEYVCPVAATIHTSDGLNAQVYNRCVGTRYCSQNCPYKVRRFNWLDYRNGPLATPAPAYNPEVTVRSRGVMEKCTYCVQRIQRQTIRAKREGRALRDGELQTACQQVCPTRAIVFGDLMDAGSRVARYREHPLSFRMLAELGTRPRTSYLAQVINPNPALMPSGDGGGEEPDDG
jgi:molybdopterin-containing oxidoreductase family iron-sulfur binding subunit